MIFCDMYLGVNQGKDVKLMREIIKIINNGMNGNGGIRWYQVKEGHLQ